MLESVTESGQLACTLADTEPDPAGDPQSNITFAPGRITVPEDHTPSGRVWIANVTRKSFSIAATNE
jgi:hypothetical protein